METQTKKGMGKKENKITIGYARISTDRQDCSMEMQRSKILDYCKFKNLPDPIFLIDEGVSGKIPIYKRPEGSKLKTAKPDNIVSIKLDRLFRSTVDALQTIELWNKQNITVHIIDMGGTSIDTDTAIGKMFITMLAGFSEFERATIAQRTTTALQHKKANLEKYGRIPYGFKEIPGVTVEKDGKTIQKYKIEKNGEMPIINRIFALRKTTTYDGIANILNSEGVPTKNNKRWYASTIRYILKNSIYACLALLFMFQVQAQELPELNRKILHFVDSVLGTQVGGKKAVCRDFVGAAAEYCGWTTEGKDRKKYYSRFLERKSMMSVLFYDAERIEPENILPGDIIHLGNHIAVIYSIEKCFSPHLTYTCFTVAEQAIPDGIKLRRKNTRVLISNIYVEMPETCLFYRLH